MLKVAGGGGVQGGVVYQGTWDASTNTPTLVSGIGTKGYYYVVSVSGSTNLDGITDWVAGDWAIFNGTAWQKVDNSEAVISVNGQTGVVVLTASNVNAVPDTATITAGTGLSGGGNLVSNVSILLANTAVSAGSYGGNTTVATFTVDQQGRLTAAANVAIDFPEVYANITVDSIDFTTNANIAITESLLTWNADTGTLAFGVEGGLPLNIGFENLVLVYNNTGSALAKGKVVSITGAQGQQPTVALSDNASEALARDTLGIVQEAIADGTTGFVCTFGVVNNINTYGTIAGDPIYLSNVAGGFTSTQPQAPNQTVALGWVIRVANTPSSNDGQIFVSVNNGWELEELHNVLISNVSANQYLVYNGTSNLWVNQTAANVVAGTGLTGGGAVIANTNVTVTLANTAVTAGTYGGSAYAPQIVIDAQGRITSASNVAIPQGTVTNVATGTGLTGGPITSTGTISLANTAVSSGIYGGSNASAQITIDAQGRITSASNVAIPQGTVTNVATGTGLTGGPITSTGTIELANTAVTAGIYGGATNSPQITVDAQGRITSASNVAISGGGGTVITNLVTITNGSEVGWTNATSVVLAWTNNSSQVIAWTGSTYNVTSNNATILANCYVEPLYIQLPSAANVSGQQFIVKKIDSSANAATITTTSSQKIDNANTYSLSAQYMSAGVQSDGSNYWVILEAT